MNWLKGEVGRSKGPKEGSLMIKIWSEEARGSESVVNDEAALEIKRADGHKEWLGIGVCTIGTGVQSLPP